MPMYVANHGDRGEVRLNGVVWRHVLWADTDNGCICAAIHPITVHDGVVQNEILYGEVEFTRFKGDENDLS